MQKKKSKIDKCDNLTNDKNQQNSTIGNKKIRVTIIFNDYKLI